MDFLKNHLLAPYTTVKIGGPADLFIDATTEDQLIEVLKYCHHQKINPTIIGNGSNILISDSGIRGLVIKNSVTKIEYNLNDRVTVSSGTLLPKLITDNANHYFSGLEEFTYIPASVGGAIWCNIHGNNKNNFSSIVLSVKIFDLKTSDIIDLDPKKLDWSYDFSEFQLKTNWIILTATLQLQPGNPVQLKRIISEIINQKAPSQPMNSLGCVFKNPEPQPAGKIIDQQLGLKGFRIGDAQVSPVHANFIVNLGKATATDYLSVIRHVQSEARTKLNLELELEIKLKGDF